MKVADRLRIKYDKVYSGRGAFPLGKAVSSVVIPARVEGTRPDVISESGNSVVHVVKEAYAREARAGNLPALLQLDKVGTRFTVSELVELGYQVAVKGHVIILRWLKGLGAPLPDIEMCMLAAHAGHSDVLEWAAQEGFDMCDPRIAQAAARGEPHLLYWTQKRSIAQVEALCAGMGELKCDP